MVLLAALLFLHGAALVGSMPSGPGVPENITVTFLSPTSIKVSWDTSVPNVNKYDVTYKPTDARVVEMVAGNSEAVTLNGLKADTQYQITVTAVWKGKKFRSRPIVFRTLEPPRTSPQQDAAGAALITGDAVGGGGGVGPSVAPSPPDNDLTPPLNSVEPEEFTNVRGVEIGIVLLVLVVWVGAIALFFNRWGKIRMLLPYQPDYKEQLKVPGSGACAAAAAASNTCNGNHSTTHVCPQNFRWSSNHVDREYWPGPSSRRQRPRINSAIFISNSGPGFDSGEFMRRYGSSSKLCRKAQSEENIPLTKSTHFGLPVLSVSGPSPPDEHQEENNEEEQQKSLDECL